MRRDGCGASLGNFAKNSFPSPDHCFDTNGSTVGINQDNENCPTNAYLAGAGGGGGGGSDDLAQLGERRSAEREAVSSNPGRTNTQGL